MSVIIQGFYTDYTQDLFQNLFFKKTTWTPATTFYLGLSTLGAFRDGTYTEVSGSGYARVSTVAADWNSSSSGTITNAVAKAFGPATADWTQANALFIADVAPVSTGNILAMIAISPVTVLNTKTYTFAIGAIRFARA